MVGLLGSIDLHSLVDARSLLDNLGPAALLIILFAETGLLVGFFLPGDSLLFTAGLLCATGASSATHLSLAPTLLCAVAGALLGAQTGFELGRRGGRPLLEKGRRPRLLEAADRAQGFIDRYGQGRALVISRFVPVVRTIVSPLAGIVGIAPRTFLLWQAVGGVIWTVGLVLAGYGLGSHISGVDKYLLPIVAVIVVVSLIPVVLELRRSRATAR
jgi:membrane-associated protein